MAWIAKPKSISVTKHASHAARRASVDGRALALKTVSFGPGELFGAAARCSSLLHVDPVAVTPESELVKALVSRHVSDASSEFSFLPSADQFKDFVGNHFTGTVAAGIAYLAMVQDGYAWVNHFENLGSANNAEARSPDFVFARNDRSGVALLESKGTRKLNSSQFDRRIENGYLDQVEPHLGYNVGNSVATHGFCIGSWMRSGTSAELFVHGTAPVSVGVPPSSSKPIGEVQRGDYVAAFQLALGPRWANQISTRAGIAEGFPVLQFEWLGRQWLTSSLVFRSQDGRLLGRFHAETPRPPWIVDQAFPPPDFPMTAFAIEKEHATAALNAFSAAEVEVVPELHIEPIGREWRDRAREEFWSAVFPDGLAVVTQKSLLKNVTLMRLNANGIFVDAEQKLGL